MGVVCDIILRILGITCRRLPVGGCDILIINLHNYYFDTKFIRVIFTRMILSRNLDKEVIGVKG